MTTKMTRRDWLTGSATAAAATLALSGTKATAQTFMQPNVNPTAENPIRAHFNENPYGQSKMAIKAMKDAFDKSHLYTFREVFDLMGLMAELEDIPFEYVTLGAGSTEILEKAAVLNHVSGGAVMSPTPTYGDIARFSKTLGTKLIEVPVGDDLAINLEAMRAAMTDEVKLIYLCNPNNPIPTIIEKNALKEFITEMSNRGVTVLVDEAYHEYVDNPDYESMVSMVRENKNVIVTRTASKIHAFAGVRIGICYSHPDFVQKSYGLFSNTLNYTAIRGAMASYRDTEYQAFLKQKNKECLEICYEMFEELGLEYVKSNANFTFFNAGRPALEVAETMKKHHILTGREFKLYSNWVRLSMTKPEEMKYFVEKYKQEYA
ncbi:pyridoxal phosphate-dependent aminotransferase [Pseudemcibacter aquimaris]|uniref:pyridoxal phosphate-dependent aminotransferase n=1 Tax=Pseudemcibacter aquimaris TaxID=2857064 RepID=UPI002013A0F4|nr:histidinol-phosphate transaminase [Pseudemcibacter aquimaris]MCC3860264.1 histidinol-phosphate aminotransferase family protein [Pseudemcibacter aquimaris]WDU57589.1 histidinol-phosphate aminotransferase family protein [Pseudemcibacter aquimaris]